MSVETHLHALPRKATVDTTYPEGVAIWDNSEKRIIVGDGATVNGVKVAMASDLTNITSRCLEQTFSAVTASNEAAFNGELYVHHLVAPSGTIYVVASGHCRWSNGYTYVKMETYLAAEGMTVISGTWIGVYNPRPSSI